MFHGTKSHGGKVIGKAWFNFSKERVSVKDFVCVLAVLEIRGKRRKNNKRTLQVSASAKK